MKYEKLFNFLKKVEKDNERNKREIISKQEINQMKADFPEVSSDYFDYLEEIGAGTFRECQFMVYSYLGTLEDFSCEHLFSSPINVLIFGDNFSGDFSAFNVDNNYSVVELWHDVGEIYETNLSFKDYIEECALMGKDESDLRKS
jgi:hypothetical protein